MKSIIITLIITAAAGLNILAAENKSNSSGCLYKQGDFTVAGFGSYRAHEFNKTDGRLGAGAEIGYFLSRNVAITLEALTENTQHSTVDEAGLNFKGYLPIKNTGFAPYGLIGVSHAFEGVTLKQISRDKESTTIRTSDEHDWRFNAGAGLEFRASKVFGVFADGRWTHDFDTLGHALFRFGLNVRF